MRSMSSKLNAWLRGCRGEQGQAMVMAAFAMVVILGFAAFAVDIGHIAVQKSDLQNAADAAALAGVVDGDKVNTAVKYAKYNGMDVTDPFVWQNGDRVDPTPLGTKQLKVQCSREVDYYFAGVFGFKSKTITAIAVAERNSTTWSGEALPFLNLGYDYSTTDPTAWTQVGPGIKGTITDFNTIGSGEDLYFDVDYEDGISIKPGFSNGEKGLDGSTLKVGLDELLDKQDENVKVVYLFSLRSDIIKSITNTEKPGTLKVMRKQGNNLKEVDTTLNGLKNGDVVLKNQLVLIQCKYLGCDNYNNQHELRLEFLGPVYDLGNTGTTDLPDLPTDYLKSTKGTGAKLVL